MNTDKKIQTRISGLEEWHKDIINQPLVSLRVNAIVALEQIRVGAVLKELYSLLGQPVPDYPMFYKRGENHATTN